MSSLREAMWNAAGYCLDKDGEPQPVFGEAPTEGRRPEPETGYVFTEGGQRFYLPISSSGDPNRWLESLSFLQITKDISFSSEVGDATKLSPTDIVGFNCEKEVVGATYGADEADLFLPWLLHWNASKMFDAGIVWGAAKGGRMINIPELTKEVICEFKEGSKGPCCQVFLYNRDAWRGEFWMGRERPHPRWRRFLALRLVPKRGGKLPDLSCQEAWRVKPCFLVGEGVLVVELSSVLTPLETVLWRIFCETIPLTVEGKVKETLLERARAAKLL